MFCVQCGSHMVHCQCVDADERIESLKGCKFLDDNMIENIKLARKDNKEAKEAEEFLAKYDYVDNNKPKE